MRSPSGISFAGVGSGGGGKARPLLDEELLLEESPPDEEEPLEDELDETPPDEEVVEPPPAPLDDELLVVEPLPDDPPLQPASNPATSKTPGNKMDFICFFPVLMEGAAYLTVRFTNGQIAITKHAVSQEGKQRWNIPSYSTLLSLVQTFIREKT